MTREITLHYARWRFRIAIANAKCFSHVGIEWDTRIQNGWLVWIGAAPFAMVSVCLWRETR